MTDYERDLLERASEELETCLSRGGQELREEIRLYLAASLPGGEIDLMAAVRAGLEGGGPK